MNSSKDSESKHPSRNVRTR